MTNQAIHKGEDKLCITKGSSKMTSPYSKEKAKKRIATVCPWAPPSTGLTLKAWSHSV